MQQNNMSEPIFVNGLRVFKPSEKAPDFIIANVILTRDELLTWLSEQTDNDIRLDIKLSKKGTYYAQVNEWRPSDQAKQVTHNDMGGIQTPPPVEEVNLDDIPF